MQSRQFTLRTLLTSTVLIAVGCLGLTMLDRWNEVPPELRFVAGFLFWTSGMWIGAGLGYAFGRWREGAAIAVWVCILAMLFLLPSAR